jgi:hypothetical protein
LNRGFQGAGGLDVGICRELCDETADCAQAGWTCEPLTSLSSDPQIQTVFGRFGLCIPPQAGADAGAP